MNKFFFIKGQGIRDSRFENTEMMLNLQFESKIYPLDTFGNKVSLENKSEEKSNPFFIYQPI